MRACRPFSGPMGLLGHVGCRGSVDHRCHAHRLEGSALKNVVIEALQRAHERRHEVREWTRRKYLLYYLKINVVLPRDYQKIDWTAKQHSSEHTPSSLLVLLFFSCFFVNISGKICHISGSLRLTVLRTLKHVFETSVPSVGPNSLLCWTCSLLSLSPIWHNSEQEIRAACTQS